MARARNIKPGFFSNDELVELSFETRLLFIGLWTIADRDGRLLDRPKKIKMDVFPADDVNVEASLQALADKGFIQRYEIAGTRCLQIVNWHKHQNPHVKEAPSTVPAPDDRRTSIRLAPDKPGANTMQASEIPERAGLIPDSPSRIPDSGFPLPAVPVERRGFARFYAAYPKKVGKGDAEKAFKKLSPSPELLNRMLEAIEKAKDSESWLESGGKYIPNPATWLNGKRWEDELKPAGTTPRAAALSLEEQNRAANEEARRLLFGDRREVFHA